MPGATLHLTHIELLAEEPALSDPVRAAIAAQITHARLGSVFVDLPFYTNIVTMMVGYALEMPAENCPFAHKMHRYRPDMFAWHVLCCCAEEGGELTRDQRLALLAGFFSHVALDLEVHPLVNWCARRDLILRGGNESHHHRLTEKYHSLFFHKDLLGSDVVGRSELFTQRARIVDHPATVRRNVHAPVVRWSTEMLAGFFHGAAPSMREFAGWVRAFRHFSLAISLPPAGGNSRRLGNADNRRRYYENDDFRFVEFWRRGYQRSIELINLAHAVVEAEDFSDTRRAAFLRRAAISDLAYPPERGLPELPRYGELALAAGPRAGTEWSSALVKGS